MGVMSTRTPRIVAATAVATIAVLAALASCYNYTGAHQKQAEVNARAWAASLGAHQAAVTCNKMDTDGDGYVSCTVAVEGQLHQIECAGEALFVRNEGCRAPKLRIPAPVQVRTGE